MNPGVDHNKTKAVAMDLLRENKGRCIKRTSSDGVPGSDGQRNLEMGRRYL